jgi:hypothetical protein
MHSASAGRGRNPSLRYAFRDRRPGGVLIRTVRIEAPTTSAAELLARDLVAFAQTDLVPLGGERWEVRVEESTEDELDAVLMAVARWAATCELEQPHVLVDREPVELPEANPPA